MAWTTPITSWSTSDGILNTDMNRIEGNNLENRNTLYETTKNRVSDFKIYIRDNAVATGAYEIGINAYSGYDYGRCTASNSQGFIQQHTGSNFLKQLTSSDFTPGSGSTTPGKAPGATYANDKWFYIFVLKNPTTDAIDYCFDDVYTGTNITGSTIETTHGFTLHKRIGAAKTSTLITPNGFIPAIGTGNYFYFGGVGTARDTTYSFTDASQHLWSLDDSNGVEIFPLPGYVTQRAHVCAYTDTGLDTLSLWGTEFGAGAQSSAAGISCLHSTGTYSEFLDILVLNSNIYAQSANGASNRTWKIRPVHYYDNCQD